MVDELRIRQARRLCLFAHYHQHGLVAPHVLHYLRALRDAGFVTVVLSTATIDAAGCKSLREVGVELILRENAGMDFGGWIEACRRFFPIEADLLLLANDSVYGPLSDLSVFVDKLLAQDGDFYGAVESLEVAPHLQSWFVLLRPTAYRSRAFAKLMCTPMPEIPDKLSLVKRYEIGLTQQLVSAGLRYRAAFSLAGRQGVARRYPYNPAHLLWRDMIEAGVPFLKVELLRLNKMGVTDTSDWAAIVSAREPALLPLIQSDLAQRGTQTRPDFFAMGSLPRIYWPEVRTMVLSDYRRSRDGAGISGALHWAAIRITMFIALCLRRVLFRP